MIPVNTKSFFFTVRLADQSSNLLVRHVDLLRNATTLTRHKWPFAIESAVILPNRLHMIWTLPMHDQDYGKRWKMIKTTFSSHLPEQIIQKARAKREWIWQRRYWEQEICSPEEMAEYLQLIKEAPVREELVKKAENWPHSSLGFTQAQNQEA